MQINLNNFILDEEDFRSEFCEDQLKTTLPPENIDAVKENIALNRHVSYREIKTSLNFSRTQVYPVLNDYLKLQKLCTL